jgi:hypothetical protein
MKLLFAAILLIITCQVSYGHDGGYSPGFEPFEHVKLYPIKACLKEKTSESRDEFKCERDAANYSVSVIREGESPKFAIKDENTTVITKRIQSDVYPYLTEAYIADLNGDGKADLIMIIPSGGSGLGSEGCYVIFALSSKNGFALTSIGSMGFRPTTVIDFFNNGHAQIVQTEFINGTEGKDGKVHNYWVYSFLEVNGIELRPSNQISRRWIMYAGKKNHKPTQQLSEQQKAALWQAQFHGYTVDIFEE